MIRMVKSQRGCN